MHAKLYRVLGVITWLTNPSGLVVRIFLCLYVYLMVFLCGLFRFDSRPVMACFTPSAISTICLFEASKFG